MAEDGTFEKTDLNTVKRYKRRAAYDTATIYSIVRAATVLHVAFVDREGLPQCIPMVGALEETPDGDAFVYLHGSSVSRFIKLNEDHVPLCITATLVDGYILSLTPYSHDVQYRTAILHGTTLPFSDEFDRDAEAAKLAALILITNAVCPGRYEHTRVPPTPAELKSTGVLRVRIESASAKVNAGGASDNATDMANEDLKARVWTGVLPLRTTAMDPIPSEHNSLTGVDVPDHVRDFQRAFEESSRGGMPS